MKDFWGVVKYFFLVGIPGLAAKELFAANHPVLAVLIIIYGFWFCLEIYDKK
jgi:hypothetical protein